MSCFALGWPQGRGSIGIRRGASAGLSSSRRMGLHGRARQPGVRAGRESHVAPLVTAAATTYTGRRQRAIKFARGRPGAAISGRPYSEQEAVMRLLAVVLVGGSVCLPTASAKAAAWEVRITDEAAVEVLCDQAPVVRSHYVFWGPQWKWAGAQIRLREAGGAEKKLSGQVRDLGLNVSGVVTSPRSNQMRLQWQLEAQRDLEGIVGGGLEFNLALDSRAVGPRPAEPVLLEGNRGWRWSTGAQGSLSVEFDPPLANVYFERGQKRQIRAMLIGQRLARGIHTFAMTVTLPQGGVVGKSLEERYGPAETKNWYSGALRPDASPVDLSFLNHKPAGKRGFVRAEGDRLVFADGSEARFWGGNLAAYALFVDKETIRTQANRIARLGYNLMRIHHHDSTRWVARTVIDKRQPDSQQLDEEVLDRLDYWIKCLKEEGVYVWLDLHVGRVFTEADGIGQGWAEIAQHGGEAKGYCYFNDRLETLMRDFNAKYLTHVNRYTGLAYKDDPAIMGLLLTNENDLTCHFGNRMLGDKGNPYHHKLFQTAVAAFAQARGLPPEQTWRTWEPGPAKLFLADREYQWNRRMLAHLEKLGVRVPVSTTQMWGDMNLCGLPPLMAGGIIDVHSYGQAEALSTNPRYEDNYVTYMAVGQAWGKPVSLTEWNVPYPARDRFTAPLYVASIAALQGWDAPMIYNYSQESFLAQRPSTWSTYSDPALTGLMPAAAMLFRQGHVQPARHTYCLMLDRQTLYYQASHPRNVAALRTLVEQSKVTLGLPDVPELDWDAASAPPASVRRVTALDRDLIPAAQDFVRSDTLELTRNWVRGAQAIDTPRTQAAQGWIGGEPLRLRHVTFRIATPKAAVAVTSLDGQAIDTSRRLLITAIARVVASPGGTLPMLSEPVRGELEIAGRPGLHLVPLAPDGKALTPLPVAYAKRRYTVVLPAPRGTHWFLLTER